MFDGLFVQRTPVHVVPQMFGNESFLDAFRRSFGHIVVVRQQTVHFGPQADEFERRLTITLIFHFAQDFGVHGRIQRVVARVAAGVEQITVL